MKFKPNETLKIKSEYTCYSLVKDIKKGSKILNDIRKAFREKNQNTIDALKSVGIIQEVKDAGNIIPTTGRNVLARLLAGDTTYSGEIDWGAIGDGSPTFTNSSTQLDNEIYRTQADSQVFDNNIVYIDWFIAAGDVADGTYTEFMASIDGSAAADSGQAWSLLETGGWVKSGSMFISAKYTLI